MLTAEEKQALAIIADYIFKNKYSTDWSFAVDLSGADIDWERHPRLIRSQSFGDPDYPTAILRLLKDIHEKDSNASRLLLSHIIGEEIPQAESLRSALAILGVIPSSGAPKIVPPKLGVTTFRYIEVDSYPDDFYSELIRIINRCYTNEIYVPITILGRKLLENALIDIFRYYYGMKAIETFFDVKRGRFHDFSFLIAKAREKLADFEWCKDVFNDALLNALDNYREIGNSSAHNLAVRITKEEIDKSRDEIVHLTKSLFKVIMLILGRRATS